MVPEENTDKKGTAESFGEIFRSFGEALSEIFNDPQLKEKAKEFGDSAAKAAKTFGSRFQDDDVKARFREAGPGAQGFGQGHTRPL
ncbi:MAG: hypothetical protein H8D49_05865 [Dehalococcoidia bacterium]|nr:hypothetical protein [Dehalococcoidia bacterium]